MKILTGKMIQEADRVTAVARGITGLELMEEASAALAEAAAGIVTPEQTEKLPLLFVIGRGNNGGDGLAMARILHGRGYRCRVLLVSEPEALSPDAASNLRRLPADMEVSSAEDAIRDNGRIATEGQSVVDAILGSGVRGPVREPIAGIIRNLNSCGAKVLSVDMPSGLPTEPGTDMADVPADTVVKAFATLTVGFPKLSLLLPETGNYGGRLTVTPLALDRGYIDSAESPYSYTELPDIARILRPRAGFSHKGDYGHALLVCGSAGMAGAAVLATLGALRSGCGLVTVHLPEKERMAIYCNCPQAMVDSDPENHFSAIPAGMDKYAAAGVGCGLGKHPDSVAALGKLLAAGLPAVVDADALNIISVNREMLDLIPRGSILTPHPGELRRLTGDWSGPYDRLEKAAVLARRTGSCVTVKGAHTAVVSPQGQIAFNSTGNPGMAKGGSGDILAGLLTGLLASGYSAFDAARLGVWLHGRAGDLAADRYSQDGMNSLDIVRFLGDAFRSVCL